MSDDYGIAALLGVEMKGDATHNRLARELREDDGCCASMRYLQLSVSGQVKLGVVWGEKFLESWKWCPWCGTKLRGEE